MNPAWWSLLVRASADLVRPAAVWATGMSAVLLLEGSLWPTVRDMPRLDELLEGYPQALTEAFGLDAMSTGTGFLNAELFTLVLPALFIAFAASRGARTFAGEEESGTLLPVLASSVSRGAVYSAKAVALLLALVVLGTVVAVATLLGSALFDIGVTPPQALVGASALVLLGAQMGCLALAVGAATGRRAWALGVTTVAAVGTYVLYVASLMTEGLAGLAPWTPYDQALGAGPLAAGVPGGFGWLVLVTVLLLLAALPLLRGRDLRG